VLLVEYADRRRDRLAQPRSSHVANPLPKTSENPSQPCGLRPRTGRKPAWMSALAVERGRRGSRPARRFAMQKIEGSCRFVRVHRARVRRGARCGWWSRVRRCRDG